MVEPVSEALKDLLRRQELRGTTGATVDLRGKNDASSRQALSVMGWANALLDREEEIEAGHSPTSGEETRPMRMRSAEISPASLGVGGPIGPSPAHGRPVPLRIVASNRQRNAQHRTGTLPRLVLIIGGKA